MIYGSFVLIEVILIYAKKIMPNKDSFHLSVLGTYYMQKRVCCVDLFVTLSHLASILTRL